MPLFSSVVEVHHMAGGNLCCLFLDASFTGLTHSESTTFANTISHSRATWRTA